MKGTTDSELIEQGWALIDDACWTLEELSRISGPILRSNHTVWSQFLNRWTNRQWLLILFTMEQLQKEQPQMFKPYQITAFKRAEDILARNWNGDTGRILDEKPNKKLAWRTLFTVLEIYRAINDIIKQQEQDVKHQLREKLFDV